MYVCMLFCLLLNLLPTPVSATNAYPVKRYQSESKKALFVMASNPSSPDLAVKNRRALDVFSQITSSYWNLDITAIEANAYADGQAEAYDITLIADFAGTNLPTVLSEDLRTVSNREIVHFGPGGHSLANQISSLPAPIYDVPMKGVEYKNTTLENNIFDPRLYYTLDATKPLPSHLSLEIPLVSTEGHSAAIRIKNSQTNTGYLFFPFALPHYYQTTSYTNAVLDVLHTPFGEMPGYPKRALIRLEDVSAYAYAKPNNGFFDSYSFLRKRDIPFHIALIERFRDPQKSIDSSTRNHRHFDYLLRQMVGEGHAVMVQHGYTHQYQNEISAFGFEFWDAKKDQPAANDSPEHARKRINSARSSMKENDLPVPDIWETPHYAYGPQANQVINEEYSIRYEQSREFGSLPFPVVVDDTTYVPETLGYINGTWHEELPAFKDRLKKVQTFRNATASFFWHPWREQHELKTLVDLLEDQNYKFVHAYDLYETNSAHEGWAALQSYRENYSDNRAYLIGNISVIVVYLILLAGALRYAQDRYRFKKYFKLTRRFHRTLEAVRYSYRAKGKSLPTFTIFVPARNEGLVIANTIENLAQLDYPKDKYQIVIITDERELDDDVDILTKKEVQYKAEQLNATYGFPLVSCVEVPDYYSGVYGDWSHTHEKSTKGRALNFALQTHHLPISWEKVDFIGVLDADGRLNRHILKEAAWEALKHDAKILQGPVYQVSNLSKVSIVGVMAGLELARYHLTNMVPRLVKPNKIQFLAGTNYFINRQLLEEIDGWDQHALVEDAELALRLYIKKRIVARALTLPEIEQTPATFKIYRRQRERWARGQFEILGTVLHSNLPLGAKIVFLRKILLSQFRFILDLALPVLAVYLLVQGYFREVQSWMQLASVVLIIATFFMWGIYAQTYRRIAEYSDLPSKGPASTRLVLKLFVFMPIFMIIQIIPRIDALYNYVTRKKVAWAKTERTAESPIG